MYKVPGGYPTGSPQGPRSLHFRGKRPIPRLPELAHAAARGRKRPLNTAIGDSEITGVAARCAGTSPSETCTILAEHVHQERAEGT